MSIWHELRRRRVFRVAGLYIVGAWLALQVADLFFPAWDIPDVALQYLLVAAVIGFPIALVFGWLYDVTPEGITRTAPADGSEDLSLKRVDFLVLSALAMVAFIVIYGSVEKVREVTTGAMIASQKPQNSVAVLPFENLDGVDDTEYFSDGVTEEILHRLSTYDRIRVMGRASSFAFKGSNTPVPDISDVLNVRYLLQGSVRRDGDTVRVTANLVDESGFQIWSNVFDRKLENIFSIQAEIAATVAQSLVAEIVPRGNRPGTTTTSTEAYRQYLIGRAHFNKRVAGWQAGAREAYATAIELDPDFAPPYAGLAIVTLLDFEGGAEQQAQRMARAQELIDTALLLDPESADAHAAQGLLFFYGIDTNFPAAEAALKRAIALDPSLVFAYNWLATTQFSLGMEDAARRTQDRALDIDPLHPVITGNASQRYSSVGDYRRALDVLMPLMQVPEPAGNTYIAIYTLHGQFGRYVEALEWAKRAALVYAERGSGCCYFHIIGLYRQLGMIEASDYWLQRHLERSRGGLSRLTVLGYIYKVDGRPDLTKQALDNYFADNDVDIASLPVFTAQILGAMLMHAGDWERGIEVVEAVVDRDRLMSRTSGGSDQALDFMLMLIYGYQQVGRDDDADVLLQVAFEYQQPIVDRNYASYPKALELLALTHALAGDDERAADVFEHAVDAGWRDYRFIIRDPRWQRIIDNPRLRSALAYVQADLDRQRQRVEAIDATDDFRSRLDALENAAKENGP